MYKEGATTFSITTFSMTTFSITTFRIMTLSSKDVFVTISINDNQHNSVSFYCHYVECRYAECRVFYRCAWCHNAECRCADCSYAECRGSMERNLKGFVKSCDLNFGKKTYFSARL